MGFDGVAGAVKHLRPNRCGTPTIIRGRGGLWAYSAKRARRDQKRQRLQADLPTDPNALVFPSRKGGFLPLGEYRWTFDNACEEVGIEGLVPHGLRHATASLAISAGANVKVVQRLLGRATAAITLDRYGHLLNDDLSGVADALGKAIDSTAVLLRYSGHPNKDESVQSML